MSTPRAQIQVTPELTRKVATLARLKLTESEVTQFTEQLARVLGYVGTLQEVDTSAADLVPMTSPLEMATPLREDVARDFSRTSDGKPKVLEHAPKTLFDGFQVPPIL